MKPEAQVWLKLINTRLLPCNHETLISRERICVLYFLMTSQKVNVGHLIRYQMSEVRKRKCIDRLSFANMLTQYLRKEEVEEERDFDKVIPPPLRLLYITRIRVKKENDIATMIGAEHNARDDSFMAHLYGMIDLQLRIRGRPATTEERATLEERYPLKPHVQQLVRLGDGQRLLDDEDVNTPICSEASQSSPTRMMMMMPREKRMRTGHVKMEPSMIRAKTMSD
nr:uncharacterized protein LOC117278208 [Nicotiana tomentosiformis]